jgi:hypothetical protein
MFDYGVWKRIASQFLYFLYLDREHLPDHFVLFPWRMQTVAKNSFACYKIYGGSIMTGEGSGAGRTPYQ